MDHDLHARVRAYHEAAGGGEGSARLAAETYRELLNVGVNAGDPNPGVLAAARIIGKKRAEAFVLREVSQFLGDLSKRAALMAAEIDANVYAEAQMAVQDVLRQREQEERGL